MPSTSSEEPFVTIARVVKTQGRHGEVAVQVHSDAPDRFHPGLKVLALDEKYARREIEVEDLWPHKDLLVLKFAGVDSISDAEAFVGCELQVPRNERAQLEAGWSYVSDLVECTVFDRDREVGKIEGVRFGSGEAPLLVVRSGRREIEIPYAEQYLQSADLAAKQIRMVLPEGLLELDAPMTKEEKEEQKRK